jgi:hypothetical protein
MPFSCSICGEESTRICVRCTKDACDNHLCDKCHKCSDCCECEVALTAHAPESVREALHPASPQSEPVVEAATVAESAPEARAQVEPGAELSPDPPVDAAAEAMPVQEVPAGPAEPVAAVTPEAPAQVEPGAELPPDPPVEAAAQMLPVHEVSAAAAPETPVEPDLDHGSNMLP